MVMVLEYFMRLFWVIDILKNTPIILHYWGMSYEDVFYSVGFSITKFSINAVV